MKTIGFLVLAAIKIPDIHNPEIRCEAILKLVSLSLIC